MTPWPYLAALSTALAVAVIVRRRLRSVGGPAFAGQLSLEEIAYLAGGPTRLVASAVSGLIVQNALRISRHGVLEATGAQPPRSDTESAVLAVLNGSRRSVRWTFSTCATHDAVAQVGAGLVVRQLLVDPQRARHALWLAVTPLMLVLLVEVVALTVTERFAGLGGLALVFTTVVLLLTMLHQPVPWRTTAGEIALWTATGGVAGRPAPRNRRQVSGMTAVVPIRGAAALVAVHGLRAHPDRVVRRALEGKPASTSGGSRRGGARWASSSWGGAGYGVPGAGMAEGAGGSECCGGGGCGGCSGGGGCCGGGGV